MKNKRKKESKKKGEEINHLFLLLIVPQGAPEKNFFNNTNLQLYR